MKERELKPNEKDLLKCLLSKLKEYSFNLDNQKVFDMDDGGMGSICFVSENKDRKLSKYIVEKKFKDSDNQIITVALNIDQYGMLFELDIWKIDFSRVIQYPKC